MSINSPEIEYENGVPIVPGVAPLIVLHGSDFAMGRQYAEQIHEIYGDWALSRLVRDFTDEQEAAIKAYAELLIEFAPEFHEMLKGMGAAAKDMGFDLDYRNFLADFNSTMSHAGRVGLPAYPGTESASSADVDLSFDCSGFAAWGGATKDGKLICSGSSDHVVEHSYIVACYPETGHNMIYRMPLEPVSLGMFPGMNDKGLSYAHHGSGIMGNEQFGYGVFGVAQVYHTLRFASSATEALEMQASYPLGTRADGLWADIHGDAGVLECRDPKTIRRPGDCGEEDFIYSTNTVLSRSLEPLISNPFGWLPLYIEHGGWQKDDFNSARRNLCMWNAFHNYHGEIDLDFVKMLWRMGGPEPEYESIEAAESGLFASKGAGWMPYIGNLANITVGIAVPDDGDAGRYYVCNGTVGTQLEPLTAGWHFYNTGQTHTFYEVQLAGDAKGLVRSAQTQAQYDLYYANRELRKLTYADSAYAPLDKLFIRASKENQKGEFYWNLALEASGDDAVNYFAKSIRFYTKAQAYAKQVFEALVSQPRTPSELGLREWMGEWGEWETGPASA